MERDRAGRLPIHYFAGDGDMDNLKKAIAEGVDVNDRDWFGRTPIHYAAIHARIEIIRVLVEAGADVNNLDQDGKSPAYVVGGPTIAATITAMTYLREHGADFTAKTVQTYFGPMSILDQITKDARLGSKRGQALAEAFKDLL